jgi:hypothetical protein
MRVGAFLALPGVGITDICLSEAFRALAQFTQE